MTATIGRGALSTSSGLVSDAYVIERQFSPAPTLLISIRLLTSGFDLQSCRNSKHRVVDLRLLKLPTSTQALPKSSAVTKQSYDSMLQKTKNLVRYCESASLRFSARGYDEGRVLFTHHFCPLPHEVQAHTIFHAAPALALLN